MDMNQLRFEIDQIDRCMAYPLCRDSSFLEM